MTVYRLCLVLVSVVLVISSFSAHAACDAPSRPLREDLQQTVAWYEKCLERIVSQSTFQISDLEDLRALAEASQRLARQTAMPEDYRRALRHILRLESASTITDPFRAEAQFLKALWIRGIPGPVAAQLAEKPFAAYESRFSIAAELLLQAAAVFGKNGLLGRAADAHYEKARVDLVRPDEVPNSPFLQMKRLVKEYEVNRSDRTRAPAAIQSLVSLQNYPGQCQEYGSAAVACLEKAHAFLEELTPEQRTSLTAIEKRLNWSLTFHYVESVHDEANRKADPVLVKKGMERLKAMVEGLDVEIQVAPGRQDLLESRLRTASVGSMILLLSSERGAGRAVFGLTTSEQTYKYVLVWLDGQKSNFPGLEMQRTAVVTLALLGLSGILPDDVIGLPDTSPSAEVQRALLLRAENTLKAQHDPMDPAFDASLERPGSQIDPAHVVLLKYARTVFLEASALTTQNVTLRERLHQEAMAGRIRLLEDLKDPSPTGINLRRSNWIMPLKVSVECLGQPTNK